MTRVRSGVSKVHVELFTPSLLASQAEGRALLDALGGHLPSWMPGRYGWSEPLRNVYAPDRAEHFWERRNGLMFRNASGDAAGEVSVRTGPWDILSKIELSGTATRAELDGGIGAFLAGCGRSLELAYAMAHIFTPQQAEEYYRAWFELPPPGDRVKTARQGPFPYFLRDLYWGNVFGPPYTELFGTDRLRTAPAAVAAELRPGYFYVQVTEAITDLRDADALARYRAVRDAVKEHLGPECFYQAGGAVPGRAPRFTTAAEDGLWKPAKGAAVSGELQALLAKAPGQ
jgi:hypothetical protein